MGDLKYLEEVSIDFDTSFVHDTNWEAYKNESTLNIRAVNFTY